MKYLYLILRLFFCSHKYKEIGRGEIVSGDICTGHYFMKSCTKCGKVTIYNCRSS